jgi:hypothetical protein
MFFAIGKMVGEMKFALKSRPSVDAGSGPFFQQRKKNLKFGMA